MKLSILSFISSLDSGTFSNGVKIIPGLVISYLIGAIPTAYIFCRILKGVDIRKTGSGNVGATNAIRVLGLLPGIVILLIDIFKGMVCPWLVADYFMGKGELLFSRTLLGIVAVLGHNWTVFLKFKGGKGVAVTLGVLIGLAIKIPDLRFLLIATLCIWLLFFTISKIVSLASLLAAIFFPIFSLLFIQDLRLFILGCILAVLLIFRHKPNIIRLLRKEEPRTNLFKTHQTP